MNYLFYLALLCGFLGFLGSIASLGLLAEDGRRSRLGLVVSASLMAVGLAIIGGLAFAPKAICEALGGGWNGPESSCLNEWGGGNDDKAKSQRI
jgi:hypothetical protein